MIRIQHVLVCLNESVQRRVDFARFWANDHAEGWLLQSFAPIGVKRAVRFDLHFKSEINECPHGRSNALTERLSPRDDNQFDFVIASFEYDRLSNFRRCHFLSTFRIFGIASRTLQIAASEAQKYCRDACVRAL